MRAYFATTSPIKLEEAEYCLRPFGIEVVMLNPGELSEVLSLDIELVSREKARAAFGRLQTPLFCEHGALEIDALSGLPGTLSKVFYESLGDRICDLLPIGAPRTAVASAAITYCDGRRMHTFVGSMPGLISPRGRGSREFYYDQIFVPEGRIKTYAEMDRDEKIRNSHIQISYNKLGAHLSHGR